MSSSRSIAAARNRRAGEQQPMQTRPGPGTSIASQAAFVQQMSQDQRSMQQIGRNQIPQNRQMNQQIKNNQQPQVSSLSNGVPPGVKLSISDAIGLVTLRLGKVEQFIIELENQTLPSLKGNNNLDNTQPIDISVINSIVNRLDNLEKAQKELSSSNLMNKDKGDNSKLEKEIRDIKDALMLQIVKYDKYSDSTNNKIIDIHQRLTDIDNAFVEFENQFNLQNINENMQINDVNDINVNMNSETMSNDDTEDSCINQNSDNAISSVDLKSAIKEQLKEI